MIRNKSNSSDTGTLPLSAIRKAGAEAAESAFQTLRFSFNILPADSARHEEGVAWRMLLMPVDAVYKAIPVELRGRAVIGLAREEADDVDLDLSEWDGYRLGVSRRHLLFEPKTAKLFVTDLGSTNGTHINGLPISPNWPHSLSNGDVITLGLLHIRVSLLAVPRVWGLD